jgi:nitrate/nitrite transporter NarK
MSETVATVAFGVWTVVSMLGEQLTIGEWMRTQISVIRRIPRATGA